MSGPRWHPVTPKRRPCSPRHGELAVKDPAQRPDAAISTADWLRALFPASPHDRLRCVARHRRAGWAGRHRPRAVQQERERVPPRGGERNAAGIRRLGPDGRFPFW